MDLLQDSPELNLYEPEMRIRTRVTGYPPAKLGRGAQVSGSLVDLGCIIDGTVQHSVLSPGVRVEEGAIVRDSIIFDDAKIEAGAVIDNAILDKEVIVRRDCHVGYGEDQTPNRERPDILSCGISIIGKRIELPTGLRIGRNCVVGPGALASDFDGDYIASGTTLRLEEHTTSFTS